MNLIISMMALAMLGGCNGQHPIGSLNQLDRIVTVEEFLAQPSVQANIRAQCDNDPGRNASNPNCVNVWNAERIAAAGSIQKIPRIAP